MIHSFRESLAKEENNSENPIWLDIYKKCLKAERIERATNIDDQKGGIDRFVYTKYEVLRVQEKLISKDYGNILLEYWSSFEDRTRGWIATDYQIDLLCYNVNFEKAWLFPWDKMRLMWKERHKYFVRNGKRIETKNVGYTTISTAVPEIWVSGSMGSFWFWERVGRSPHWPRGR